VANQVIRTADGGSFNAYVAAPKGGKGPGLVVIQEIFGVNAWLREVADDLAAQGYVAMAPDLFWRLKPGIELSAESEAQFQEAIGYMQRFDEGKGVEDLKATLAALRQHPASTGKAGSIGYCLGGRLAYLLACRSDADANVGYYGVNLPAVLGEARNLKKPLMLHVAENDKFVPPAAQAQIKEGLKGLNQVTIHSYPGADHGFARRSSHAYNPEAAKLANARSAEFLRRALA